MGLPLFGHADHENNSNYNRKVVGIRVTLTKQKAILETYVYE